jgi:hypothetical protein
MPRNVTSESADLSTIAALRGLSERYARAVDRRDGAAFAEVFVAEGRIQVFSPEDSPTPIGETAGNAALAGVPDAVGSRYFKTQHFLGQSTYEVSGAVATGEVYCMAHHLSPLPRGGNADYVMFIRYADRYSRGEDGGWRIAERRVLVDWTETRTANPIGG